MFGDLETQLEFGKRHKLLIDNIPNMKALADIALSDCKTSTFDALTLWMLARVAIEDDFWSIVILSANGFPHSAKQILRGMFERVVTLSYLAAHPEEVPLFNDYFEVDQQKRVSAAERNKPGGFSQDFIEETKARYEEVKDNYMITNCKKCKTKRLNHMWSKKNLVAMAEEVGFSFDTIESAYYIPLEEAHPKIDALFARTKEEANGSVSYNERPGVEEADETVLTASILQLKVFEVLKEHFKIQTMEEPFSPYLVGLSKYLESIRLKRQSQA